MQLFSVSTFAQKASANAIIFWTESRKLQLQDFKVVSDSVAAVDENVAALTRTGITYYLTTDKVNGKPVSIRITVQATVHKEHTFIKERVLDFSPSVKQRLLMHEQKHFDISEIFAREATRELQNLKLTKEDYQNEIASFVQEKFKAAEEFQRYYDLDTRNGEDFAAQDEWDERIALQLEALDRYKKKVLVKRL
ncbi:DUF922 domain-containing protein [Niabella ginsengisoli]|uniref:DUF922 domain-containing Zn-dependent protease n=1 Tax=Niabella ginsengisoli TaxID=522298 RepID=A0ABS9SLN1_9BACT|nr:DUF922 domain-containing protein [Niabella ginsengisoli]MCH5599274.1 DUF922 domain-containing Zn-dependent protease [Niabella ginsengisoli]